MLKETVHKYKGFEIIGTFYHSSGGYVLGNRCFKEGGLKRNYNIKKDGKYILDPYTIIEKLSHAKEEVDRIIAKKKEG